MQVVIAQLNYTVGDLAANSAQILQCIRQYGDQADLIVFSELAVSGYYPYDLLDRDSFLQAEQAAVAQIAAATQSCSAAVMLGHIGRGTGLKGLRNAVSVFKAGHTLFHYHKTALPTYNVFTEDRHFGRGELQQTRSFMLSGLRIGVLNCEDAWHREAAGEDSVVYLAKEKPDLVIHINASPSNLGKAAQREQVVAAAISSIGAPMIYVNQVGAHDEMVYDGGSFMLDAQQQKCVQLPYFETAVQCIDTTQINQSHVPHLDSHSFIHRQLRLGLQDYLRKCGLQRVLIGSSGGIDSAVTIALAADALGAEHVTAITMPGPFSSSGSVTDSVALCEQLGVQLLTAPITPHYEQLLQHLPTAFGHDLGRLTRENLQARLRGITLMAYSNQHGALLLSTGNKSELSVGYATLYGDMNGGLNLIGDLYKMEVYALANYLNAEVFKRAVIPQAIIDKAPSAELSPDQKDSDSLPPYPQLDSLLKLYLEKPMLSPQEIATCLAAIDSMDDASIDRILRMVDRAEFKRHQAPPIIRVHKRAFGDGRRLLISHGFVDHAASLRQ